MSNTPQAQKPQAQNTPSSIQNQNKTAQKDESGKDRMKNEGGNSATSDKKSS